MILMKEQLGYTGGNMSNKYYLSAPNLYIESFELGMKIFESGYRPDYIVGIWRGGAPVGIIVQELLYYLGVSTDHISIRTSSYEGLDKRGKEIQVHGLGYLVKNVNAEDSLLIVDDVYETGLSIQEVVEKLRLYCRKNTPDIRVATLYYKPDKNKTLRKPDYYQYKTDNWIVFPHELQSLTIDEIIENKHFEISCAFRDKLRKLKS
jgi:hypoxanthine phosphoribosyltransferase